MKVSLTPFSRVYPLRLSRRCSAVSLARCRAGRGIGADIPGAGAAAERGVDDQWGEGKADAGHEFERGNQDGETAGD